MDKVQADLTEDGELTIEIAGNEAKFKDVVDFRLHMNRPYDKEYNSSGKLIKLVPTGEMTITLTFKVKTDAPAPIELKEP